MPSLPGLTQTRPGRLIGNAATLRLWSWEFKSPPGHPRMVELAYTYG